MAGPCPHDHGDLDALRDWAWARGRTDVVLTLDVHARAWAFHAAPTRENLVRLAAIAPPDGDPGGHVHRLAIAGAAPPEYAALRAQLREVGEAWCVRVDAELDEMRAASDTAPA